MSPRLSSARELRHLTTLETFEPSHLTLLEAWLAEPHVAPWFSDPKGALAYAESLPANGFQALIAFSGRPAGYLRWQFVERQALDALGLRDIPANSVDADILISGAAGAGRGIGPAALRLLAERLSENPDCPMLGLTSEKTNLRAHRAFQRAGFRIDREYHPPGVPPCYLLLLDLPLRE